ncbi:CheY-like receiver domain-containing protein [Thermanaerovibrio velox DSM 12556]|uniref:CheY-like receiver domain-containing protein n=1 Tax=Thermanaerovibrio velox DSM 12556 TaxID=926567 RepID=H0UN97_9BACT|nr:response regulator [Thermanaerovibrio velox]EHM10382.1 CheY-like receiver domain-containing protein [Thermanaerovibrio velox DSM 12556]
MDSSTLKSLLHGVKNASSQRELITVFFKGLSEISQSPSCAVWFSNGEDEAYFWDDGILRSLKDFPKEVADKLWLYLKSIESPSDVPAMRDRDDPLCFPGWLCVDRGALAPFNTWRVSGWVGAFGRSFPYNSDDLLSLWILGELFALSLDALKGRVRLGEMEQWGHYLRTPLWTLSLALEDLKNQYSPQSASLAFGAARVLSSQIDTLLCEIELESQRFGAYMPLSEALEALRTLGQGWQRMENRGFEMFIEGMDPSSQIKYGALQMLMGIVNMYYVDMSAQSVSVGVVGDSSKVKVMIEASSLSQGSTFGLRGVVELLAERYSDGISFFSSVQGEGVDVDISIRRLASSIPRSLGRAPKVLVVDDSMVNRKSLSVMLEKMGATVISASDGVEAVDLAMSQMPDIVFMDLLMPRMGGVEATAKLREMGFDKPILALTAGGESDLAGALEAGMDETLFKPVSAKLLRDVVAQWTGWNCDDAEGDPVVALAKDDFLKELPGLAEGLCDAIARNDMERVEKLAHRLKGDSAVAGYRSFSSLMAELEEDMRAGKPLDKYRDYLSSGDLVNRLNTL